MTSKAIENTPRDVYVELKSRQWVDRQVQPPIELFTQGKITKRGEKVYLSYQESDLMGGEGVETKVKAQPGQVTIMRFGDHSMHMVFEEGKPHQCLYRTDFGELVVGIHTKKLENKLTEKGGTLSVRYNMEINHSGVSENEITLKVEEI